VINVNTPPAEFDEAAYLTANPDVAIAVGEGRLSSGWQHVLIQGHREPRLTLLGNVKAEVMEYWRSVAAATPPAHLRERVHGARDEMSFHSVGVQVSDDLEAVLVKYDRAVTSHLSVFDFGCGCGRILWHVKRRHPTWTIVGRDIDAEAIAWCRQHLLTFGDFEANAQWPPTSLESASFDLIYAISVFTHLREDMQFAWLEELRRLAKPGALLLLSVHPMTVTTQTVASQVRKLALLPLRRSLQQAVKRLKTALQIPKGFAYSIGDGTAGLPDFYQTTFHSRAYVHDKWSRYFDIVEIIEKGINNQQALVVARRRP
jgi:trans-aconitate methyltransferase